MIRLVNALGAEKLLPETIIFKLVPLEFTLPNQPLYGSSGSIKTGKSTILPRHLILDGRIYYQDKDRIEKELDSILSFLLNPPIEVYRLHTHNRHLKAYPLGAPQDWIDLGAELGLRLPMAALDPYWYGPEIETIISGTQDIEVGGTAPTHPLVKTAGSVTGLSVVNGLTNKAITITGATGIIIVDNINYTVTVDNENRLDLINNDWLLHGFELLPGKNQITTNTPITLTYRERWY